MTDLGVVMAKLSGIRKAVLALMAENVSNLRSAGEVKTRSNFRPTEVQHYFDQAAAHLDALRAALPHLYDDFQAIETEGEIEMAPLGPSDPVPPNFSRSQVGRLVRDIDQVFEIRANSELTPPVPATQSIRRVFVSHGRSNEWRKVQPFIEKDIGLLTAELAQEPNLGRTVMEKLVDTADICDSAVIVMTGDDIAGEDEARVRENVMHEIGYFQGKYGRRSVVLLHEEGVNIPSNLSGVVYVPFPQGTVEAGFHVLQRELKAIYAK